MFEGASHNVDSPSARAHDMPQNNSPKSINMRTADRKMLAVKGWVGKGTFSTAFFDSIRNDLRTRGKMGGWGGEGGDRNEIIV